MILQKKHQGLDFVGVGLIQYFLAQNSAFSLFHTGILIKLPEDLRHAGPYLQTFRISQEPLFDKLLPTAYIQLRPNQINQRFDILILSEWCGRQSDLDMCQHRVDNLLVALGRQPLCLIEHDKTPGHFLKPFVGF